ncbi:MAG: hypothetical protein IJ794_11540 [Lachnospiraceae bacterium]|nr:hypothetical protein [Lachnospiraceae bacterium]
MTAATYGLVECSRSLYVAACVLRRLGYYGGYIAGKKLKNLQVNIDRIIRAMYN